MTHHPTNDDLSPPAGARALAALRAGDFAGALAALEDCPPVDRESLVLHIALAEWLTDQDQPERAAALYCRALAADSSLPEVHHNLAALYLHLNRPDPAAEHCRTALRLRPNYALAWNTLGVALTRLNRFSEAIDALAAALRCRPGYAKAAYNLGQALDQAARPDEAIVAYRRALALDPGLAEAEYDLAALGAQRPPAQMPAGYVRTFFDGYAANFEQHLTSLGYAAPQMLLDAVAAARAGSAARIGQAIDLGCGTGLVGAAFRPLVDRLIGVDLSPAMLAASARRGIYDELHRGDVSAFLAGQAQTPGPTCELLLAADLLIYLGDLGPLFASAAGCLRPGGWFALTIEVSDCTAQPYVLRATRRYAHAPQYVRRLATEHGLAEVAARAGTLRAEGPGGIDGLALVFEKADGAC